MPAGHENDELVISLAESVLGQPPDSREEFLRFVCGGDAALIETVSTCVQRLNETGSFAKDVDPTRGNPVSDALAPGTVLADRFRIVRAVGAGGMGMVYEAIDQSLDRRIAIKCARAGHPMSLPPEARAAREVSHFNVCKVHELHTAMTDAGEVNFLSMEFVDGETLWARIRRGGPLRGREAVGIARQICAGLAQAHRQGVIHGDLKVANVILAEAPDGGTRAVITDFGLAKFAAPDGSRITSSRGGTRDYMAPELLEGQPASVASDLYALGVLFHVMLTGRTPEWAKSGASRTPASSGDGTVTMLKPLAGSDRRRRVERLPRPWRRVVEKCLAPDPARRFASAQLAGDALAPRRTALKAGAAIVLLAAAGAGYREWREPPSGPEVRLAVLPFQVERGAGAEVSGVAVEIAERLSGARRKFTVITPVEARQNQVDTPEKARSILAATHVLQTRIAGAAGQLGVEAQLVDLQSGNVVRALKSTYPAGDPAALAKALIGTVTAGLNLKPRGPKDGVADKAYPAYIEGLNTIRQDPQKADAAIASLERAIALDGGSALPYAALASVQAQKFRNGDGRQWLDRAAESAAKAAGINPDSAQVLSASGQVEQFSGRYEQAVADFSRAATLDPGNPTVWRLLAETYHLAGRDEDAVSTYRKAIDAEPGGYQTYVNFGNYYLARGQYQQAEEMYRKTTALAPGLVIGHMNLGLALKQQGRYGEAERSLLKARALGSSARLLLNLGALYYEQERYAEALRLFEESARAGAPSAQMRRNLGDAYRHLSRAPEAMKEYRAAREETEAEVTTNPRSAEARARLALLSARLGDAHRASYELSQALAMASGNATVIANAVQALEVLKERDKAIEILQKAPRSLLQGLGRVPDLRELRLDPRFQQLIQKP